MSAGFINLHFIFGLLFLHMFTKIYSLVPGNLNPKSNPIFEFTNGGKSRVNRGVRSRERWGSVSIVAVGHKSICYSFVCNGKV